MKMKCGLLFRKGVEEEAEVVVEEEEEEKEVKLKESPGLKPLHLLFTPPGRGAVLTQSSQTQKGECKAN